MTFYVIGIGNYKVAFTEKLQTRINNTYVFSGGKRHLSLVRHALPKDYQWITINSPMQTVFEQYETCKGDIVVFASGNPLFYGFANTLKARYPKATIHVEPYFSSIQLLTSKTNSNSNDLVTVSIHGRSWQALDSALIKQLPLIGVLTDAEKNPKTIAKRLLQYGYTNYNISIGEDLEGDKEYVQTLSLEDAQKKEYHHLNCVLLHKTEHKFQQFGIDNKRFAGLEGRPNMITKMPVRLVTLQALDILNTKVLWDIGFCTGSISIEAKLKQPDLDVVAFEKRDVCERIMIDNQKRFGVPGIQTVMGDIFDKDLSQYPKPDAVFIGGHGGKLEALLKTLNNYIEHNTRIVINAVQEASAAAFIERCKTLEWDVAQDMTISLDTHNPIRILKAIKH